MPDDRAPEKRTGGKEMPEAKPEHLKDIPAKDGVTDKEGNVKGGSYGFIGEPRPKL